ncbi:MAG: diguanylate cyclase [Symploca sp. SIO2E6]|nr:diguanylate cyclase [Symploca sp. SIO2E6]
MINNFTRLLIIIILAGAYFCTAGLGQMLAFLPENLSAVWLPTGISLAAILWLGYEMWPAIALGSFLWLMFELQSTTLSVSLAVSVAIAVSITVGETLKPILIAILLNRFVEGGAIFQRIENVGKFVLIASIGSMISAIIDLTTLCLSGITPWGDYGLTWWTWWLSSIISILIFTPLLLTCKPNQAKLNNSQTTQKQELLILPFHAPKNLLVEGVLLLMLVLMVSLSSFGGGYPVHYFLVSLLLWSVLRFGKQTATLLVVIVSVIAILGTAKGFGPFIRVSYQESLFLLQSFISALAVTALVLSAFLNELEERVQEHTVIIEEANQKLLVEVSERQRVEAALEESQHLIQRIADSTPNILYLHDLNQQRNIYANRELPVMLGYQPEEIDKMGTALMQNLMHSEDFAKLHQRFQKFDSLSDGEVIESEYRLRDKYGEWRWFHTWETVFTKTVSGSPQQILGTAQEITERKQVEEALRVVNGQLADWVNELEQRNQEMAILSKINDFMQACVKVEEAYEAISALVAPLFPNVSGGLFIINSSKHWLESVATWGDQFTSSTLLKPDECWALRRGQLHGVNDTDTDVLCQHYHHPPLPKQSLCIPMMAQGETLGMLCLSSAEPGKLTKAKKQLAITVAEQIALSLANLQLRERLRNQSIRDPLTGLFNRRYMEKSLQQELYRAERNQKPLGLIMLDIDHFKRFNDNFGHEAGDMVLQELGKFLQENVRKSDIACRYGGEELMLILPEASLENSKQRAEEIRSGVKQLKVHNGRQCLGQVTISLGVACFPQQGLSGNSIIQAADSALYQAKKEGRDRTVVYVG